MQKKDLENSLQSRTLGIDRPDSEADPVKIVCIAALSGWYGKGQLLQLLLTIQPDHVVILQTQTAPQALITTACTTREIPYTYYAKTSMQYPTIHSLYIFLPRSYERMKQGSMYLQNLVEHYQQIQIPVHFIYPWCSISDDPDHPVQGKRDSSVKTYNYADIPAAKRVQIYREDKEVLNIYKADREKSYGSQYLPDEEDLDRSTRQRYMQK